MRDFALAGDVAPWLVHDGGVLCDESQPVVNLNTHTHTQNVLHLLLAAFNLSQDGGAL